MKQTVCLLLITLLTFNSCEEVVTIDTGALDERIIIEGLVTNAVDRSYIKITRSRDFYAQGPAERITNALVEVTVNGTEIVPFTHNPTNDPLKEGIYYPIGGFTGSVGNEYALSVDVQGALFEASETMLPVTTIDSLTTKFDQSEFDDPEVPGRYYEVLLNAKEPQDTDDNYLFKFYRNDSVVRDFPTDVYVANDDLLGEEIAELEIAGYFAVGDVARVEMYSLTPKAFSFYSDLNNLINGDGGMFSPPPANPRNNLSNDALGYFQVSALAQEELVVYDPRNN